MVRLTGLASCFFLSHVCPAAEALPDAAAVTRRMVERAQAIARAEHGSQYTYDKRSLMEQLDSSGQVLKTEGRLYQVRLIAGFPFNRLVQIQGRDLTSEELMKEEQKEEKFRQRLTSVDPRKMAAGKDGWVTEQLLERYAFTVKERVTLNQRPTLVLTFRPKDAQLPAKNFLDKILNRLAGTVWVDEADAEAAKLSVGMSEGISVGLFGMLGAVSQCDLSLERQRMPDAVWVNAKQVLLLHYRKLTATTRFRKTEGSSGFQKVDLGTLGPGAL